MYLPACLPTYLPTYLPTKYVLGMLGIYVGAKASFMVPLQAVWPSGHAPDKTSTNKTMLTCILATKCLTPMSCATQIGTTHQRAGSVDLH